MNFEWHRWRWRWWWWWYWQRQWQYKDHLDRGIEAILNVRVHIFSFSALRLLELLISKIVFVPLSQSLQHYCILHFVQTLNRTYRFYSLIGVSILIFHFLPRGMMDKVGDQWTSAAPTCFYAFAISVLSSLSLVPALCSIFLLLDSSLQFLFLCSLFRLPVFLWWDQFAPQMHQDWGLHRSPSICG